MDFHQGLRQGSHLTYGAQVGNSSATGLNKFVAVSEWTVDACSNFLYPILGMTATISVCPCPLVRDLKHEGWTRLRGGVGT
eukprot:891124-Pelagomonas_calceolata.AAC.1